VRYELCLDSWWRQSAGRRVVGKHGPWQTRLEGRVACRVDGIQAFLHSLLPKETTQVSARIRCVSARMTKRFLLLIRICGRPDGVGMSSSSPSNTGRVAREPPPTSSRPPPERHYDAERGRATAL
jgi:hypothetical protein